ncbi:hypothetical protein AHAS_Ahas13G0304300 [Arachis hypogaea]
MEAIKTKGGTKPLKLNSTKMLKSTTINIPKVNHNTNIPTNNPHNLNLKGSTYTHIVGLALPSNQPHMNDTIHTFT